MKQWNKIRSNWVNGELDEAKDQLYQQSKLGILKTILQALIGYHNSCLARCSDGSLIDLMEILSSITQIPIVKLRKH